MKSICLLLLVILFITSCSDEKNIVLNRTLNSDIINRRVEKINTLTDLSNLKTQSYKFSYLTILDSDCNTCFRIMNDWQNIDFSEELGNANKIFVVQGRMTDMMKRFLSEKNNNFLTIYLDTGRSFILDNKLTGYYQKTLLLDSNKRIVYVGSPLDNSITQNDLKFLLNE
jgi:hypothetical protein